MVVALVFVAELLVEGWEKGLLEKPLPAEGLGAADSPLFLLLLLIAPSPPLALSRGTDNPRGRLPSWLELWALIALLRGADGTAATYLLEGSVGSRQVKAKERKAVSPPASALEERGEKEADFPPVVQAKKQGMYS